MANVNIKFNGKEFLLSCDDGQEEHLEELSIYLNNKFDDLKNSLLASSDIFVMPSIIHKSSVEGFGIAYVEAAQYGIPVSYTHLRAHET